MNSSEPLTGLLLVLAELLFFSQLLQLCQEAAIGLHLRPHVFQQRSCFTERHAPSRDQERENECRGSRAPEKAVHEHASAAHQRALCV